MTENNGTSRQASPGKRMARRTVVLLVKNFFDHDVGKNAAALAYYLLFALFPLLIFLSNLLGLLDLDVAGVMQALQQFLPKDIVDLVGTYLGYVSQTSSHSLLWFALVFSIWFPMRAAKGLMDDVRLAYHLGKPAHPVAYSIRQLAYTVVLLLVIALTLFFTTMGQHAVSYLVNFLTGSTWQISDYLLTGWQYLRFLLVAVLMFAALGSLYTVSLDSRQTVRSILPGITASLAVWMMVSIGFSFYVENFANYSIIYGTLGAVIVLLMWLYMTAGILIMGAELNSALQDARADIDGGDAG